MLQEIRELGFEYAELGHGTRISLVPGILEAVDAGLVRITSLHNFCPLPMGVTHAAPNIYQFTSENPRERDQAYRHTLKTLDFAQRLKARLVVLHMGSVPLKNYTDRLLDLLKEGQRDTPKFQRLCDEVMEKREARKERHLGYAYEILNRLAMEAEARGILLGVENREALEEVPFESDFMLFFREFRNPAVCYWHDTGHAQIKHNLGFIDHQMHLESLADRLAGFHLHDVEPPGRDHRPPGQGMIDFAGLKPWVKPEHLKVFELSPSVTAEEVRAGVEHLKRIWGEE